jgi:Skp family chaperone for outer membrane proteins
MKNRMITVTGLCVVLISSTLSNADDKNKSVRSFSAAEIAGDSSVMTDLAIGFVDSFAIMGECEEGQKARKEIEAKRDFASQEIQEESKKLEKAKSDYISKSSMMSDSAREKEEKLLKKKDNELRAFVAEKEEELKSEMQVATETLAQSLDAGVVELAKKEDLDVIFDKMTGRAMYVSPKFDYTDKAIKKVNEKYEVKLAQAKQSEQALKVADNKAAAAPKATKVGA